MPDEPSRYREGPVTDELSRRIGEVAAGVNRLEEKLERAYLTREVYKNNREADRDDVKSLTLRMDNAERQRASDRRLILSAFVAPILTALIVLYVVAQLGGAPA